MTTLRLEDGVKTGLCAKGQRRFCRAHGIDFVAFARDGLDSSMLEHIEDANLQRALKAAEDREATDGQEQ